MESGILTVVQEQQLAVMVDDALKLKGLLEWIDGYLAKVLITILDDKLVDKLKEDLKIKLASLVDAAMAKDVELSETIAADIVNSLVDVPGLDETTEGLLFRGAIEIAVGAILNWIAKAKGEPVTLSLGR